MLGPNRSLGNSISTGLSEELGDRDFQKGKMEETSHAGNVLKVKDIIK